MPAPCETDSAASIQIEMPADAPENHSAPQMK
jgi:hypothetical protein